MNDGTGKLVFGDGTELKIEKSRFMKQTNITEHFSFYICNMTFFLKSQKILIYIFSQKRFLVNNNF